MTHNELMKTGYHTTYNCDKCFNEWIAKYSQLLDELQLSLFDNFQIPGCRHQNLINVGDADHEQWVCTDCSDKPSGKDTDEIPF